MSVSSLSREPRPPASTKASALRLRLPAAPGCGTASLLPCFDQALRRPRPAPVPALPMSSSNTYYHVSAPEPEPRPPLEGTVETEVAVVGGGLAGLATALSLAERGRRVVVLEARAIGAGASGRNGGMVSA